MFGVRAVRNTGEGLRDNGVKGAGGSTGMYEGGKVVVVRADADWISTCLVAVNEINRCGCDWGWLVWQGGILGGGCGRPVGRLAG